MRRFFAPPENFQNQKVALSQEESKHLRDVLRLREGEKVLVFDGEGNEFTCLIEKIGRGKDSCVLKIIEKSAPFAPESPLNLTLGIALLKGEKFDLVVQKATELGVKKIIPLQTKRADVKLETNSAGKKLERWQKIALEAAKQCGRSVVPKIGLPEEFEKIVLQLAKDEIGVLFSEKSGASLAEMKSQKSAEMIVIVGSEGGWEDSEIELARANDWQIITLGGRILRAETAGIVAVTLLQNIFGDLL